MMSSLGGLDSGMTRGIGEDERAFQKVLYCTVRCSRALCDRDTVLHVLLYSIVQHSTMQYVQR